MTNLMRNTIVALALLSIAQTANATSPVMVTFERQVCESQYIFVGRVVDVRIVRTRQHCNETERPELPGRNGEEGLRDSCEAFELGLSIERVIKPSDWRPFFSEITYRLHYPGSLQALQRELSGQQRLFYANDFVDGYHGDLFRKLKAAFEPVGAAVTEFERVKSHADGNCNVRMRGYLIE